ncbi:MAG: MFS transporter [Clostridia bacterium]|nr:MFS transporter [Clostridia bacterium]
MDRKKYVQKNEMTAFCVAGLGQGMIYALMSSYISDYYLNVLQLAPMFVLLLMLLARVWDAINDPLMGMIVDRSNLKSGKMIPFIRFALIPIAIVTILMYLSPNLDKTQMMIYSAIVYVAWGMLYTVGDVSFWGLPNVMTPDSEERSSVISVSKIFNSIGSAVPEVLFLVVGLIMAAIVENSAEPMDALTVQKRKYLIMAIVTVGIGSVLYAVSCFGVKERVKMPPRKRQPGEPSQLKRIFTCKPLMLVLLMGILSSGRYMVGAAAIHVARYSFYIGPELATLATEAERIAAVEASISTVKTVFQISSIVGLFGATLFMPKLMKKFDYKKLVIVSCLAGFVASIVTTLVGWFTMNLYACIPFIIISCIPLGVINTVCFAMICDCLDYMELKTGFRDNALGAACQGFINKIGNAFATSGIVIMYMVIGLKPEQMLSSTAVVAATEMPDNLRFAMFTLVSIVPGISMLLCSIPMFFYKIAGKEKERIVTELAAKRESEGFVVES